MNIHFPDAEIKKTNSVTFIKSLCIFLCAFHLAMSTPALFAGPQGGKVVGGSGSISTSSKTTTINQNTKRLAIDWKSFDVSKDERVHFKQPSSSSVALNRILSQNPSQIFGTIDANGRIVLMNPNGVIFGKSAQVNVGALIAGGLDIDPQEFMQGQYQFTDINGKGSVINHGTLKAATGGSITLVGSSVKNNGVILAKQGRVNLVAGSQVTVDFEGDGLVQFSIDEELKDTDGESIAVNNAGTINADGGEVVLSAKVAKDVFSSVVNNEGLIKAARIEKKGGVVRLVGLGGPVVQQGKINVSSDTEAGRVEISGDTVKHRGQTIADSNNGKAGSIIIKAKSKTMIEANSQISAQAKASGQGGQVHILGEDIVVAANSSVDASGANGGGEVLVGGDMHGANTTITNAKNVTVEAGADLKADADVHGDGGKVIVWADGRTDFDGAAYARGGSLSGDGGFIEISGRETLDYTGHIDVTATNGVHGEVLFDPVDFEICQVGLTCVTGALSTISGATLSTILSLVSQFTLSTTGGGAEPGDFTFTDDVTWSTDADLILNVDRNLTINGQLLATNPGSLFRSNGQTGTATINNNVSAGEIFIASQSFVHNTGITNATGGNLTIIGDTIALNGGSLSSNSAVLIQPRVIALVIPPNPPVFSSTPISLGAEQMGSMSLTNAELSLISAPTLEIGSANSPEDITIRGDIDLPNISTLILRNNAAIDNAAANNTITVTNLALDGGLDIGMTNPIRVAVDNLVAQSTTSGDIDITTAEDLVIPSTTISGITGISTTASDINIIAGDTVTVNAELNARSNGNVNITTTSGDIQVNADMLSTASNMGNAGDGTGTIALDAQAGSITTDGNGVLRALDGSAALSAVVAVGSALLPIDIEVETLAGVVTSLNGGFFARAGGNQNLAVNTVNMINGIATNAGNVELSHTDVNRQIAAVDDLGFDAITTNGGDVLIQADRADLNNAGGDNLSINAGQSGNVSIVPLTNGTNIRLGSGGAGFLVVNVENILADTVTVGDKNTGGVFFNGSFAAPNLSTLAFVSGGEIDRTAASIIQVGMQGGGSIAFDAEGPIGITTNEIQIHANEVAAISRNSGDISIELRGFGGVSPDLTITDLAGISGVSTTAGSITIDQTVGDLIINSEVNARSNGSVNLISRQNDDTIILNSDVLSTAAAMGNAGDGSGVISLTSGAEITGGMGTIRASNGSLSITADNGIGSATAPVQTQVANLALANLINGDVYVSEFDGLSISSVGMVNGVSVQNANFDLDAGGNVAIEALIDTGTGDIDLDAGSNEISRINGATITGNNLTLTSDLIALGSAANEITMTGQILLQPETTNQSIGIGGGAGAYNLDDAEIGTLTNGATGIQIGRDDGDGVMTIDQVMFTDPVVFSEPGTNGEINIIGTVTGSDNASLTFVGSGDTTTVSADVITDGNDIVFNDRVIIAGNVEVNTDNDMNTDLPGDIRFLFDVDADNSANARSIALDSGLGDITFDGNIGSAEFLETFFVIGANTTTLNDVTVGSTFFNVDSQFIRLGGDIRTNAAPIATDVRLDAVQAITLLDDILIDADGSMGDGLINLEGDIDGAFTLTLNAGEDIFLLQDRVGQNTPLTGIDATGRLGFIQEGATTDGIQQYTVSDSLSLNGDFITGGFDFRVLGDAILRSDVTIDTNQPMGMPMLSGDTLFDDTVNADSATNNRSLALNVGMGNVIFNEAIGNNEALDSLNVVMSNTTTFNSTVNIGQTLLNVDAEFINLGGNVTTDGANVSLEADQGFTLLQDVAIASNGALSDGFINIEGAVDSAVGTNRVFMLDSGGALSVLNGNIGQNQALDILMVSGGTISVLADVMTINQQTFTGDTTLTGTHMSQSAGFSVTGNTTLADDVIINTNGDIVFTGIIDGPNDLELNSSSGNDILVTDTVGGLQPLTFIHITDAQNSRFQGDVTAELFIQDDGQGETRFDRSVQLLGAGIDVLTERFTSFGLIDATAMGGGIDINARDQIGLSAGLRTNQFGEIIVTTRDNDILMENAFIESGLGNVSILSGRDLFADTNSPITSAGGGVSVVADVNQSGQGGIFFDAGINSDGDVTASNTDDSFFDGVLSGMGGLIKEGLGLLALNAQNNYQGNTNILEGTLAVDGAIQGGRVIVMQDAALAGFGNIDVPVEAQGQSFVLPGRSPGILTTGDLNLDNMSNTQFEINGLAAGNNNNNHDQIVVNGTVIILDANLDIVQGFTPDSAAELVLIDNDGNDPVVGIFNGLPEGDIVINNFDASGFVALITYQGGDGNDVALQLVDLDDINNDNQGIDDIIDDIIGQVIHPDEFELLSGDNAIVDELFCIQPAPEEQYQGPYACKLGQGL